MIKQSVKSIVKPVASHAIEDNVIKRNLVTFDSVAASHCVLDTPWSPSGATWCIEVDVMSTDTVTEYQCCLGGSVVSNDEISLYVLNTGEVRTRCYKDAQSQVVIDSNGFNVNDGKLHTLKVQRVPNGKVQLYIDGVYANQGTWSMSGGEDIKYIGKRSTITSSDFDGIVSDVRLIDLEDDSNSLRFKVDTLSGNSESSIIGSGSITYVNVAAGDREAFSLDVGSNSWVADDGSPTIERA